MSAQTHQFRYESPLGTLSLELEGNLCRRISFDSCSAPECSPDHPAALWLRGYFHGKPLPLPQLAPATTPFQNKLRKALLDIPFGKVMTYGELAKKLGTSPRALGQALVANPLPILIPCHRIVAANGLGGFGGGETWKRKLLTWEGALAPAEAAT